MTVIITQADQPCCLCDRTDGTVEARFQDRSFHGLVCFRHLAYLMGADLSTDCEPTLETSGPTVTHA